MPISSTRIKFLDKENKILVKDLRDVVTNDIFSNIVTPLLESDLFKQFDGLQSLYDLQDGLRDIYSQLTDSGMKDFVIKNLLGSLDFSNPALAHLAGTISLIKSMDEKSVEVFISTVLTQSADQLFDNPSIFQNYKSIGTDAKTQILLTALDVFGKRVASGAISPTTISASLREAADGITGVDTSAITTLLEGVKFTQLAYDPDKPVEGGYKIPDDFYGNGGRGTVGDKGGGDGSGGGGTDPPPVDVPYLNSLFIAYLSIRREAYARIAYQAVNDPFWFIQYRVLIGEEPTEWLKLHIKNFFLNTTLSMAHFGDAMMCFLNSQLLGHVYPASNGSNGPEVPVSTVNQFVEAIDLMLNHVYFDDMRKSKADKFTHLEGDIPTVVDYLYKVANLNSGVMWPSPDYKNPDGELLGVVTALEAYASTMIDETVKVYRSEVSASNEPDVLAVPVLYARLKIMRKLLPMSQSVTILSFEPALRLFLTMKVAQSLFIERVRPALTSQGFKVGNALVPYCFQEGMPNHIYQLLTCMNNYLLLGKMERIFLTLEGKAVIAVLHGPTSYSSGVTVEHYNGQDGILKVINALAPKEFSLRTQNHYFYFVPPNFSTAEYTAMTVKLDRIKYAGNKVRIV